MSMLSSQCERLRDRADELRMLASGMDAPYIVPETKKTMAYAMCSAAHELNAAADTIEAQRDKLQSVIGTRYCELFGTPERAARTLSIMQRCELGIIGNCDDCEMHDACRVRDGDYNELLEWLKGGSE